MPAPPLTWGPRALPVPYAARWSGESAGRSGRLIVRPRGIAYRDEVADDRDRNGVLWCRVGHAPGEGRPDYKSMHPRRQREAMLHRLCQVCGGPADQNGKGLLFLLPRSDAVGDGGATDDVEGSYTTKPPICLPCAGVALRHCPHLTEPLFVRSRKPRVWGVFGDLFTPAGTLAPSEGAGSYLPYGHLATPWFLASQSVAQLDRCTRVTLKPG